MGRFLRCLLLILVVVCEISGAPAHAAEGGGASSSDTPVFVKMPGIAFSVIGSNNKIQKEIQLLISLELEKGKVEAALDPFKRRLQDAYLVSLADMWESRPADAPPVSGDEIKDKLLQITTDTAGPGIVKSVLILGIGERSHAR
ncbi:MAG TPA: hypothetical protein VGV37_21460 [Aliidongia sp.]|uniref:hypothetical protein n=1 Tax=Aliidongia sp. TaxID=1914230 RepID=UPI002DDD424A|nr:hypothetical protein [Aliidongia sp.]HEV2677111.1 hypothetical protein [Aliidongia sp.]